MKRTIVSLACALVAPLAFAQTGTTTTEQTTTTQPTTTRETTTTSTKASGTVTTYEPRKRIIVKEETGNPISYVLGKTVHYVNKAGRKIDEHVIRPGARVIVHYTGTGETRTVERVEVED
jgi:Cu/Zn superoxide dismutase